MYSILVIQNDKLSTNHANLKVFNSLDQEGMRMVLQCLKVELPSIGENEASIQETLLLEREKINELLSWKVSPAELWERIHLQTRCYIEGLCACFLTVKISLDMNRYIRLGYHQIQGLLWNGGFLLLATWYWTWKTCHVKFSLIELISPLFDCCPVQPDRQARNNLRRLSTFENWLKCDI